MACRVVSLIQQEPEPLADFQITSTGPSSNLHWERLRRSWVERSGETRDGVLDPELFLFFTGDGFRHHSGPDFLAEVLSAAQASCPGATVYVVVPSTSNPRHSRFFPWLEVALQRRVSDLLQVPYRLTDPESISPLWRTTGSGLSLLDDVSQRASGRLRLLRRPELAGSWTCYFRPERFGLERLLFGTHWPNAPSSCENVLAIFDENEEQKQQALINDVRSTCAGSGRLLAATTAAVEPSDALMRFCRERTVTMKPLSFSGDLELWFFVRRLRSLWRIQPETVAVGAVQLAFETTDACPSLLLTSSWGAEETGSFSRSAELFGRMVAKSPVTMDAHVDPVVDPGRLAQFLDHGHSTSQPLIWLHLGPGHPEGCLPDFSGTPQTPAEWLNPFVQGGRAILLAIFLCEGSVAIARRFAEAGAKTAVGFAERPLAGGSVRLATEILQAALQHHGSQEAVRRAFSAEHLDAKGRISASQPAVFVPRTP